MNQYQTRRGERGNALFLILIAVALFAALSYAVTQSGRGSGSIDRETSLINSSQLLQFPSAVRTAVTRMVLTGSAVTAVDFDAANSGADAVFDSAGGGVVAQSPPASAVDASTVTATVPGGVWRYKAVPAAGNPWFVEGIGSTSGAEAFAFIGVTTNTCTAINDGLGLASSTPVAETGGAFDTTADANEGDPAAQAASSSAAEGANDATIGKGHTTGQAFSCVSNHATNTTGPFMYYHALIEQ